MRKIMKIPDWVKLHFLKPYSQIIQCQTLFLPPDPAHGDGGAGLLHPLRRARGPWWSQVITHRHQASGGRGSASREDRSADSDHTRQSFRAWPDIHLCVCVFVCSFVGWRVFEKRNTCNVILLRPPLYFLTLFLVVVVLLLPPPYLPFHITHMGELAQGSPPSCNPPPPTPLLFLQPQNVSFSFSGNVP